METCWLTHAGRISFGTTQARPNVMPSPVMLRRMSLAWRTTPRSPAACSSEMNASPSLSKRRSKMFWLRTSAKRARLGR